MSANTDSCTLSPELFDHIIDHLHNDHPTLLSCSLVCRDWLPSSRYHLFQYICLYGKSTDRTLAHFKNFINVCPSVSVCVRELHVKASRKMRIYSYRKKRTTTEQGDAHDGEEDEVAEDDPDEEEEEGEEEEEEDEIAGDIEDDDEDEDEDDQNDDEDANEEDRGKPTGYTIPHATIDLWDLSAVTCRLPRLHTVDIHGVSWPGGLKTVDAPPGGEIRLVAAPSVQKLRVSEIEDDPDIIDFLDIFQLFPHVKDFQVDSVSWKSNPQKIHMANNIPPDLRIETVLLYGFVFLSPILEHTGEELLSTVKDLRIDLSVDLDPPLWSSVINRASSSLTRLDIGVDLYSMDWPSIDILPCKKLENLVLTQLRSWHEDGDYGEASYTILSQMPPTLKHVTFVLTDPKSLKAELELWDWDSLNDILASFADLKAVRFAFQGDYQKGLGYPVHDPEEDVKAIIRRGLPEFLTKGILRLT